MRHGNKINHLGRKTSHRKAMLSNMASSLIEHKAIRTTLPKARELRKYIEPLMTKAKNDTVHSRRVVFSYLQSKTAVKELFTEIGPKIMDRPGGYTRILKLGPRAGDNAEMAYIELVDYNEFFTKSSGAAKRRRGKKKKADEAPAAAKPATKVAEAPAAEAPVSEAPAIDTASEETTSEE